MEWTLLIRKARPLILFALLLTCLVGCVSRATPDATGRMTSIGQPRDRDTSGMEPYEIAVAELLDHMVDTAAALAQIQDHETSSQAAGMVDRARPIFIELRRAMHQGEATRNISQAQLVLRYGATYLWSTYQIEKELKRIKAIGPEAHTPIKDAMMRLKQGLKDAGLPDEP